MEGASMAVVIGIVSGDGGGWMGQVGVGEEYL